MPGSGVQKPFFIGIDVGGTNIKIGLVDDTGRTLAYHSMPTDQEKGPEDACVRMGLAARRIISEARVSAGDVVRAGLATPGPMDIPTGMILRPGNLPEWRDFPIRDRASHHVGVPVTFANDANAAAYGEFWRGAGPSIAAWYCSRLGPGSAAGLSFATCSLKASTVAAASAATSS